VGAEGLHGDAEGLRVANGVGEFDLDAVGEAGGNDVLATQRAA
jgi:hypothetical protein